MPTYGLYPWTPDYGYRYVHPASRLLFEDVEPINKVFERLGDAPPDRDGEWLLLRYDDATFKVRPDLFSELGGRARHLPFGFGETVRERVGPDGQPPRRGTIAGIVWHSATDRPRYTLWLGKRRGDRTYEADELVAEY
jgi:hypothetical protein